MSDPKTSIKTFLPRYIIYVLFFLIFISCNSNKIEESKPQSLADARKGFVTKFTKQTGEKGEVEIPPAKLFSIVNYTTNIGKMAAYLSPIPADGKLHPAIIWLVGGFGNEIGDVWTERNPENDQSAAAFREAGLVMMYPSQRGGNKNPGSDETCFGEIDDILAAADFLATQKGIDPKRIYLGGHSTGGTKALLAAECSNKFRAVFSFGPVGAVQDYGDEYLTFDTTNQKEFELRAPIKWLPSMQTVSYVFEGTGGNIFSLNELKARATAEGNQLLHFYEVTDKDHFTELQPMCKIVAQKILEDDKGGDVNMNFEKEIINIK